MRERQSGLVATGIDAYAPAELLSLPALMLISATFFHVLPRDDIVRGRRVADEKPDHVF
jgi:hypothetical protein